MAGSRLNRGDPSPRNPSAIQEALEVPLRNRRGSVSSATVMERQACSLVLSRRQFVPDIATFCPVAVLPQISLFSEI